MNDNLPEVLKIVLFSKDYNSLSNEDKVDALKMAYGSNKEEMYIAKLEHNYRAIRKIKDENQILDKLYSEVENE